MAGNATVTNILADGQPNAAAPVMQNFNDILTWINTNAVHLDASKPFTSVPSGPASDPVSANEFTRKAYVDGLTGPGVVLVSPEERWVLSATALTGTVDVDCASGTAHLWSVAATANGTLNFRGDGSNTLSSRLLVGDSVTVVVGIPQGVTPYRVTAVQVDGAAVTPLWQGGSAPSAGNASSTDLYSFTIIKTAATPTYVVLASQTRFA